MDTIIISELEVFYCVGVTEQERATPQRLQISLELSHPFQDAAVNDNLAETINYDAICQRLLKFGEGTHWQLIETLAVDIAEVILDEFAPTSVFVEVKKFVIPQARSVGVRVRRPLQ